MRRLLAILVVVGLTGIGSGCEHTHGVCDCAAGPGPEWVPPVPRAASDQVVPAEPIKVMPKGNP
jgi:hypothetical protein